MNAINYKQFRAFAAQYGTVIGLMWIVSFSFYIIGLTHPLIGNISLLTGLCSFPVAVFFIRKFKRDIAAINFSQAWWMSILIYMYASLLMAVAQFIYFRYIDNGLLVNTYASIMQQPEAVAMMQQMMPGEDVTAAGQKVIELLQSISPIQLTFQFLTYNLFMGALISIPTAFIGVRGKKHITHSQN